MELGIIILIALVVPFVAIWPLLIWAGAVKILYSLIRGKVREKAIAH